MSCGPATSSGLCPVYVKNGDGEAARPHCRNLLSCKAKGIGAHCRPCANTIRNARPDVRAKTSAAMKKRMEDPVFKARQSALSSASVRKRMAADPAFAAKLREHGLRHAAEVLNTPEARARNTAPEVRAKAGQSIRAVKLAWCPEEYWPFNASLKAKGLTLAERQSVIADEIERKSPAAVARRQIEQFNRDQRARHEREKAQAY